MADEDRIRRIGAPESGVFDRPADAYAEAQRRIAHATTLDHEPVRLGLNDLRGLNQLPPEIARASNIVRLDLQGTRVKDISPIEKLLALQHLNLGNTPISDVRPVANLRALQHLNLARTQVRDITLLASLVALNILDLTGTQISDIASLANLVAIRHLCLAKTQVGDLTPLASLAALQHLDLAGTAVVDISSLSGLAALQRLDLASTQVRDISLLSNLVALRHLDLKGTPVGNIDPLSPLDALQHLDLANTQVGDISPLSSLLALQHLVLEKTPISDVNPLSALVGLKHLNLDETLVGDISPLSSLIMLEHLDLNGAPVADIRPLSGLNELKHLDLRKTHVDDLDPLAGLKRLIDGIMISNSDGIGYAETPSAEKFPLNRLCRLPEPALTVESMNYLRVKNGYPKYVPKGYRSPSNIEQLLNENSPVESNEEKLDQIWAFEQRPATYRFPFRDGKFHGEPQREAPSDEALVSQIYEELKKKLSDTRNRLARGNAPNRVLSVLDRTLADLGSTIESVQPGLLLMRSRTLESIVSAYDTPAGRSELSEDALMLVIDAVESLADLKACYPQLARLEAERLALDLLTRDVDAVLDKMAEIREIAESSVVISPSAVGALHAGIPELEAAQEIITSSVRNEAKSTAIETRAKTAAQMLLDYRNLIASTAKRAAEETAAFGVDSWKEIRNSGPNALYSVGVAALAFHLAGPTIALAAFVGAFRPLAQHARTLVEKIVGKDDRTHPLTS